MGKRLMLVIHIGLSFLHRQELAPDIGLYCRPAAVASQGPFPPLLWISSDRLYGKKEFVKGFYKVRRGLLARLSEAL